MPWHLAHSLLGSVSLTPSGKLLESCPFGHILECRGIASAVPVTIDKIEVNLDFHIFDILDFDLLIGVENTHHSSLGYLYEELGNLTSATPCLGNPLVKPCPKQNMLEKMMHEQASSSSIELEPRPTSSQCVVLVQDRDTTMIFHDEPLETESHKARESSEALTLELEGKDFVDEHGSFILESPSPCPYNTLPESATLRTMNAFKGYNHLKALCGKMFRRMVVDSYVYRKHCKFCGCTIALTLQLKHNR